jgi:hypothetical protein
MPTTADGTGELGPGTLTIGETGTLIDVSCLVNNAVISADKTEADATTKLCGTVRVGAITYDYTLSGNVDVDAGLSTGLFAMSQEHPGEEFPYVFTPSTAVGTTASGTLVIDPLDFGADEYGADLTSDFEFTLVGAPAYVYGDGLTPAVAETADESETPRAAKARKSTAA